MNTPVPPVRSATMAGIAAAAVSGVLMWLAFPPANWGAVVFIAPVPLLWALRRVETAPRAAGLGFLFGAVFFGATLSWLRVLGVVAWIPLVIVMTVGASLCALAIFVGRHWSPWRWWVVAVGSWALWEFLRARWPFGGFPWGSTGYPIGTLAWPRGSAQWIGASGWSVLVVGLAAAVALLLEGERRPLKAMVSVVAGLSLLGALFAPSAAGPALAVTIVQGNSPCPLVHCEGEREIILEWHLLLTSTIEPGSADLIVWGENSFGGSVTPTFNPDVRAAMEEEARRTGSYLLVSGTRSAGPEHFDNVNIVFGPDGRLIGEYQKRQPVPFGEYVPFRWLANWIPQLERVPRDMTRGDGPVVFPIAVDGGDDGVFGSVISFEGAFVRMLRDGVSAGAEMMVVPTNEASFGEGPASDQLIGMVAMSAASLGIDIVVAAVTGKSTIVGADGSVGPTTDLFESAVLTGTVNLHQGRRTLYAVAGDWLQLAAIAALGAVAVGTLGLRRREE